MTGGINFILDFSLQLKLIYEIFLINKSFMQQNVYNKKKEAAASFINYFYRISINILRHNEVHLLAVFGNSLHVRILLYAPVQYRTF